MTLLDILCLTEELKQKLCGMFVQNIYDLDSRSFCLKFSKPDQPKLFLTITQRCFYVTETLASENTSLPSNFAIKLRKHIRKKKLFDFKTLGKDRVIKLDFGQFFILVEFYASGNILLTDSEYKILSVLRIYSVNDNKVAVNYTYPLENVVEVLNKPGDESLLSLRRAARKVEGGKKVSNVLFSKFSSVSKFGKDVLLHGMAMVGLDVNKELLELDEEEQQKLFEGLLIAHELLENTSKRMEYNISFVDTGGSGAKAYNSFDCVRFKQYENQGLQFIKFESFNEAVREFFSKLNSHRIERQLQTVKNAAEKKFNKVKKEQTERIEKMKEDSEVEVQKAQLILSSLQVVQNCLAVINSALENSLDWGEMQQLVDNEKKKGNPVAKIIKKLNLEKQKVEVILEGESVVLDVSKSAQANADQYFQKSKRSVRNAKIAAKVSGKLISEAENKMSKDIETQTNQRNIKMSKLSKKRTAFWFEKFHWCLTSSGNLVIGGKSSQQNEVLVKRYLRKNDLFIHADLHGAPTVILRAKSSDINLTGDYTNNVLPFNLRDVNEACTFAVCRSKSWESKKLNKVYYVFANQVSKTAPSGEYLSVGSFMIRGRKNFVSVNRLEMSFGFLFKLDETQPSFEEREDEWKLETDSAFEQISVAESSLEGESSLIRSADVKVIKQQNKVEKREVEERLKEAQDNNVRKSTRGKKGKLKKIKKKYRDQSAEDRVAAMKALGHRVDEVKISESDSKKNIQNGASTKSEISKKRLPKSEKFETEEHTLMEEDFRVQGYTKYPTKDDVLLYAVPLCAPNLSSYKYSIKFQPGTARRGKMSKEILVRFKQLSTATEEEKFLMSLVDENYVITSLLTGMKLQSKGRGQLR
eukprot:snap_masked-scaffold_2-processed-gene-2.10-mRNA-1 protein AED:0.09 eAED:0.10 QI:0/-1/0/1/-1/1/1/0/867